MFPVDEPSRTCKKTLLSSPLFAFFFSPFLRPLLLLSGRWRAARRCLFESSFLYLGGPLITFIL